MSSSIPGFAQRTDGGYPYGDLQFEIDTPGFLQHGICSYYRPVADDTPLGVATELTAEDWNRLLHLVQTDSTRALELFQSDW